MSVDWSKALRREIQSNSCRIWMPLVKSEFGESDGDDKKDAKVEKEPQNNQLSPNCYFPLEIKEVECYGLSLIDAIQESGHAPGTSARTGSDTLTARKVVEVPTAPIDVFALLSISGISFFFRVLRALSTLHRNSGDSAAARSYTGQSSYSSICSIGHASPLRVLAVNLAANLCGLQFQHFSARQSHWEGTF